MGKLIVLNVVTILLIVFTIYLCKKKITNEKGKYFLFLIASILTILCHYSLMFYYLFKNGTCLEYLSHNPNLIIPIYPCNVVMWCCLIFGIKKNKESKVSKFFIDYIFFFGVVSCLVGMFANVDFINNPTLTDYAVTKSILAHAFMLFNVLLLPVFGYVKVDLPKNMLNIAISVFMMLIVGLYCSLLFATLVSYEEAYNINSMFLLHSPFEGVGFLTYPFISVVALVLYFIALNIAELFKYKKDNLWFKRYKIITQGKN